MKKTMRSRLLPGVLLAGGFLVSASCFAQPASGTGGGYRYQSPSSKDASMAPAGNNTRSVPGQWKKGDKLPAEYRDRQYVVDDWRQYNLPQPTKGRHWVGVGANFYLVAPNGSIAEVGGGS
ncbi:RcnB family protein [Cupriavidus basilensis]|jgi:Ni/Co efflux regulator RcnB|nr:integral membrane protein [Cupriavidus sp. SK-3]